MTTKIKLLPTGDKLNPHPEIKKLVVAWCDLVPYMAIWDKVKLAQDITECFNKIATQQNDDNKLL